MEQRPPPVLRTNDSQHAPFSAKTPNWAQDTNVEQYLVILASVSSALDREQRACEGLMARSGITCTDDWLESDNSRIQFITINGPSAWALWQTLWRTLSTADVWIMKAQRATVKLLICDMDSTLIPTESLDELAAHVGIGEQVAQITARAMKGELDFVEALNERVGLLKGLDYAVVEDCVTQTEFNSGALELIKHARSLGVYTVLVSGGFTQFADHVGRTLGFEKVVANKLEIKDGKLTGRVLDPIVTKDTKLNVLQALCKELDISEEHCCTIGDGANDIPMLIAAGTGVAYRAKPVVLEATPFHLTHAPLSVLKKMLRWGG